MEPNACIKRINEAGRGPDCDRVEVTRACIDLLGWLKRGGAHPDLPLRFPVDVLLHPSEHPVKLKAMLLVWGELHSELYVLPARPKNF